MALDLLIVLLMAPTAFLVLGARGLQSFYERRDRKERELRSGGEGGRPVAQRSYTGEPVRQFPPVWTRLGAGVRDSYAGRMASPTHLESRRNSIMIPGAGAHSQVSPTQSGFISNTSPSMYYQTLDADSSVSLHPTITPEPIHPVTTPGSPPTHRDTLSSDGRASLPSATYPDSIYPVSTLPSYPGTARSMSPPRYSDLSRTRPGRTLTMGGSSRGVSISNESAFDPMFDLGYLEEGRGRV